MNKGVHKPTGKGAPKGAPPQRNPQGAGKAIPPAPKSVWAGDKVKGRKS